MKNYRTEIPPTETEIREAFADNGHPFSIYVSREVIKFLLKPLLEDGEYLFSLTSGNELIATILEKLEKDREFIKKSGDYR
jgi:hypothetical protein